VHVHRPHGKVIKVSGAVASFNHIFMLTGLQKDENLVSVLKLFTFRVEKGELLL